ncbi:MAG: transcription termination factor NusA [Clostridia bacterium]
MINKDFFAALNELEREKRIDKAVFIESLEAGLVSAYKKECGEARNVSVQLNEEKGSITAIAYKTIVEEVADPEKEISLEDAKEIKASYKVGDLVAEEISPKNFTRIAAQTAKQVIMQRLNDVHKNMVLDEMNEKEGEILTAIVRRVENDTVYLEMSGTQLEGVMMLSDQIKGERYEVNGVVKVYVKSTRSTPRGSTQVIVSRSNIGFVKRLFELEVPEIKEGLISIKKIVREAGYRTKIAVFAEDESVDAIGACIGNKGMRINSIVQQLNGEKIDVINWCSDPLEFIARALSPSEVLMVQLNADDKCARAIVPDGKLSLAIGKAGQNVRLAAKLTEWKIDVKPYSSVEEMTKANAENDESSEDDESVENAESVENTESVENAESVESAESVENATKDAVVEE